MIRYYFGSTRYTDKNGKIKYKTYKKDEYPDIGWIKDPKNAFDRQVNKKAEKLLDQLIESKNVDLRRGKLSMMTEEAKKANMLQDFEKYYQSKGYTKSSISGHITTLNKLKDFAGSDYITYSNINTQFCKGYLDFLSNQEFVRGKLNKNTVQSYFNNFKVFLGEMKQKGRLLNYPAEDVKAKGEAHKQKDILTKDELQTLIKTDIRAHRSLKPFFIFSCLTGQAHEECRLMTWKMIEQDGNRFYIRSKRKKTGKPYRIPINSQAMNVLSKRPNDQNQKVFPTLKYSAQQNNILQEWADNAEIQKQVTPHVARHTFSSMYYEKTKDVGALMMILNHKDISTTQRYLAGLLGDDYFKNKDVELETFEF